jgi:hypothetical protein
MQDWMLEVEKRFHWALEPHGGAALSAAIIGFCFFLGVMMAAGLVATCRGAVRTWRSRNAGKGVTYLGHLEIEVDSPSAPMSVPASTPPPLPGRLLN